MRKILGPVDCGFCGLDFFGAAEAAQGPGSPGEGQGPLKSSRPPSGLTSDTNCEQAVTAVMQVCISSPLRVLHTCAGQPKIGACHISREEQYPGHVAQGFLGRKFSGGFWEPGKNPSAQDTEFDPAPQPQNWESLSGGTMGIESTKMSYLPGQSARYAGLLAIEMTQLKKALLRDWSDARNR